MRKKSFQTSCIFWKLIDFSLKYNASCENNAKFNLRKQQPLHHIRTIGTDQNFSFKIFLFLLNWYTKGPREVGAPTDLVDTFFLPIGASTEAWWVLGSGQNQWETMFLLSFSSGLQKCGRALGIQEWGVKGAEYKVRGSVGDRFRFVFVASAFSTQPQHA